MVAGGVHGCQGSMHGCRGACMVAGGGWWACMVAGGVCVVVGGMHGCRGAYMVGGRGHAWLWGACMVVGVHGCRGVCIGYNEIRSMSRQYASYWYAFLFIYNKSTSRRALSPAH